MTIALTRKHYKTTGKEIGYFKKFLFWDNCSFPCSFKKQNREFLCTLYLVSPNGNILQILPLQNYS